MYELSGIMIHQGGAYGGHYSAYIKDFEADSEDSWYHFNDSSVRKIPLSQITEAFGKDSSHSNKNLGANFSNAYMLIYRLVPRENSEIVKYVGLD